MVQKDTPHPMFIVAPFTIARARRQPECPLTDERIKTLRCMSTVEYYSATAKSGIVAFATTWMDVETIILIIFNFH